MDLPEGFDLEALLAPIEGDAPQGGDLREDFSAQSPYYRLRDARSEARDAEKLLDQGETDARDPMPLWRSVRDIGTKALIEQSKDLEVAAWMTEALIRINGLRGLAAGAQLIAGLAERYWDALYPLPDDYGMETRVAPVTGLNGREGGGSLVQPLYKITLYTRADGSPFAFYQYQASQQLASLDAERREQRVAAGAVPFEEVEKEARSIGVRSFAALRKDATDARDAWQAMATLLDEKAGADGPSTSHVRDQLSTLVEIGSRYAPEEASAEVSSEAASEAASADGGSGGTVVSGVTVRGPGQIATREDALRALTELATYFRRSEPHSPLSYTLDEAVRRGRMTWPELLAEIVSDTDARNAILNNLGIRPPPPPEEAQ